MSYVAITGNVSAFFQKREIKFSSAKKKISAVGKCTSEGQSFVAEKAAGWHCKVAQIGTFTS